MLNPAVRLDRLGIIWNGYWSFGRIFVTSFVTSNRNLLPELKECSSICYQKSKIAFLNKENLPETAQKMLKDEKACKSGL